VTQPERPTVKTTEQARQAETGRSVRQVLLTGLGLVVIAFALVWLLGRFAV
jgi:hypothetical protein